MIAEKYCELNMVRNDTLASPTVMSTSGTLTDSRMLLSGMRYLIYLNKVNVLRLSLLHVLIENSHPNPLSSNTLAHTHKICQLI